MEHTILFGNGINRLSANSVSWNDLLINLSKKDGYDLNIGNKPYTMVYEELLLSGGLSEIEIKEFIIEGLKDSGSNKFYNMMRDLGLNNYLTTNYEFNLEKSFEEQNVQCKNNKQENIYSIRTFTEIMLNGNKTPKIWHIHGDIDRVKSISLGLDHYCGTIGKMDGYFKGTYEYVSNGNKVRIEALSKKIKAEGLLHDGLSWIELFFTTNVHIVGLSLDYSETDLWWLLNRRARPLNVSSDTIKNRIIYYDTELNTHKATDKEQLLKAFNVEYIHMPIINNNWDEAYSNIFEIINKNISNK